MKLTIDPHTHTYYSHGKDSIEENVVWAMNKGLEGIVISEHSQNHFHARHLCFDKYKEMKMEIERLKQKYPNIKIYFALECNIISSDGDIDLRDDVKELLDFYYIGFHYLVKMKTIGDFWRIQGRNFFRNKVGFKFLFKYLEEENTKTAVLAVQKNKPKMFTHPTSYVNLNITELAEACEKTGTILEINTHRKKLATEEIVKIQNKNVSFAVGSDAHQKENVGEVAEALEIVRASGVLISRVVNIKE